MSLKFLSADIVGREYKNQWTSQLCGGGGGAGLWGRGGRGGEPRGKGPGSLWDRGKKQNSQLKWREPGAIGKFVCNIA